MQEPTTSDNSHGERRFGPRIALVVVAAVLLVIVMSGRGLVVLYTDALWFSDLGAGSVFSTLVWSRITPAVVFGIAMFLIMLVNLVVADRAAPKFRTTGPEDEVIERYRSVVDPYAGRLRAGVAVLFGVIVGLGASGEWRDWILFQHRTSWGVKDAQFGKDLGFYVFELPFYKFVADWLFVALFVVLIVTAGFH